MYECRKSGSTGCGKSYTARRLSQEFGFRHYELENIKYAISPATGTIVLLWNDLEAFEQLLDIPDITGWQMQKDNSERFLKWQVSNYSKMDIINGIVCFGIFEKENRLILGAVGAGEHDDLHETEICYNLLPEARGKGYAAEAGP